MSAQIAKTGLTFKLPESLSYHTTWDDADYEPVLPARTRGLLARLAGAVVARFNQWVERRTALEELSGMNDRELADIGLSRSDIPRVTEPGFVEEHATRGVVHA